MANAVFADPMQVLSSERGVVRVFVADESVALGPEAVHAFLGDGIELDAAKVEVFEAEIIAEMGLSTYLEDGYGIPAEEMETDILDALEGVIVLVASSAFQGRAVRLAPNPAFRFVGAFQEPGNAPPKRMAAPKAADGTISVEALPQPTAASGSIPAWLIALVALLLAAGLVLFLVF